MVPKKGAHTEELDERLVEARNEVLLAGERIVAQEPADQGQAIVLTDSRIIILKVGITATGTLNGRKISVCPLGNITKISVRKGPMGAVIQVCGSETKLTPGERPPENLVVFNGDEKVKRCEAIAQKMEAAIGRPVERIDSKSEAAAAPVPTADEALAPPAPRKRAAKKAPTLEAQVIETTEPVSEPMPDVIAKITEPAPAKPRGRRVAKSLAEEMYGDMTPTPAATSQAHEQPVAQPIIETIPELEPATEPLAAIVESEPEVKIGLEPKFRPNPNLPKPGYRSRGPNKILVAFGMLTVFVLLGIAIIGPIQQQKSVPVVVINIDQITSSASLLRKQYTEILDYNAKILAALGRSDSNVAVVISAVASGNSQSIASAIGKDVTDEVLTEITKLPAPPGLAGAKENLLSGLFIRKAAIEGAGGSPAETLSKLKESDAQIQKGTLAIETMLKDLDSRISKRAAKPK